METNVTMANFEAEVLQHKGLVLVDFWAVWCGPCQMVAPILHEIAEEQAGRIKICKVNVDEAMDLAGAFAIESIPTLILFKDGKPVKKQIGFGGKASIEAMWANL